MRGVWNAIQSIAATGCRWAMLPKVFPPFTTLQYYFYQLQDSGVLDVLNDTLFGAARILPPPENQPVTSQEKPLRNIGSDS